MSVFQLNDWWSCNIQEGDYDVGCMCVGNIDNATPASNKIIVSSLQGILRVYSPNQPQYRVDNLLLEESLGLPVIQLLCGQFIPSTDIIGLAVLHPMKLVIYEFVAGRGGAKESHNSQSLPNFYKLQKCYEHGLGIDGKHFTAYNMISGNFGEVVGREMIMVQSMDGKIQIFEQSSNAFTRQLADCLIPGPLAYLPRLDAFVVSNYSTQVECYRYQVLANSQSEIGTNSNSSSTDGIDNKLISGINKGSFGLNLVRSTLVEWSIILGEDCKQICTGYFIRLPVSNSNNNGKKSFKNSQVLILCEHSLFLLKESGGMIQQRRLEQDPACIHTYQPINNKHETSNFLLAYQDGTIQVYADFVLFWTTKIAGLAPTSVPVDVAVSSFGGQHGFIVTLTDIGELGISYLGTKPPTNAVATIASNRRDLDYDKIDEEHLALLQIIRGSQQDAKVETKHKLIIKSQVSKFLDKECISYIDLPADVVPSAVLSSAASSFASTAAQSPIKVCVRVYLSYSDKQGLSNVSLSISTPDWIHVYPRNIVIDKVSGLSTPVVSKLYFYATKSSLPSSLAVTITATYKSPNGEPRVTSHVLRLPLNLACRLKAPSKNAVYKLTVDTTADAVALPELFEDFIACSQEGGISTNDTLGKTANNAIAFQYWTSSGTSIVNSSSSGSSSSSTTSSTSSSLSPAIVSILVSKQTGRYRVQSDDLAALYLICNELVVRLTAYLSARQHDSDGGTSSSSSRKLCTCSDPLFMSDYYDIIASHLHLRKQNEDELSQLNDASHMFRTIEKRLLVRYKDKNPTPIGGLDTLIKETYNRLLSLSDSIQGNSRKMLLYMSDIHNVSKLISLQCYLKFSLSQDEQQVLCSHLCPSLTEGSQQGWEETVDASVTYLLKTVLAKTKKDGAILSATLLGSMPNDIESLKRHINVLIDRMEQGSKLIVYKDSSNSENKK